MRSRTACYDRAVRRVPSGRTITLERLLARQKATLRKRPEFALLEEMLRGSPGLRAARLSRTAARLLDEPRLKPEFLMNFYATYGLRKHLFYPMFLQLKWSAVVRRKEAARDKRARVEALMSSYPEDVLRLMGWLAAAEGKRRPEAPVVHEVLIPRTLKRARELASFTRPRWVALLRRTVAAIAGGYRTIALPRADALIALSILDCLPDPLTGEAPSAAVVKGKFRELSKVRHPDSGGDGAAFRLLAWARDVALGNDA